MSMKPPSRNVKEPIGHMSLKVRQKPGMGGETWEIQHTADILKHAFLTDIYVLHILLRLHLNFPNSCIIGNFLD